MMVIQSTYDEMADSESRLLAALKSLNALAYAYSTPDDPVWCALKEQVNEAINLSIGVKP